MAKKSKKTREVTPIVADNMSAPLSEHDKMMAEIARLKQEEIDSGAWEIWKASQRRVGWDPDHQAARQSRSADSPISALMFERATGAPPERDDLERCNCPNAGIVGHLTCGWCNECARPRFMCPHPLSYHLTYRARTVPRRGR